MGGKDESAGRLHAERNPGRIAMIRPVSFQKRLSGSFT